MMTRTIVFLSLAASLAAQQNLPEPSKIESPSQFQSGSSPTAPTAPALKATPPVAQPPPKPVVNESLAPREAADAVGEEELKGIIETLRATYVRPAELEEPALSRARLQGLLQRMGNGARIYAGPSQTAAETQPFRAAMLSNDIAYVRVGSLGPDAAANLDTALDSYKKPPGALVLDLRATPPNSDFEQAAEICRRFCPKGRILFSIKRTRANDEEVLTSRMDPRYRGPLVVLVDGDTAGSGEVIAAVLRTHLGAYVIGSQTRGEAAQFEEIALEKGRVLKVAVGEVTLPDATPVFPGGLRPDLVVEVPQEKTDEVLFAAQQEKELAQFVTESERARMNEAALVAGTNPETDAAIEAQRKKASGESAKPPLRDVVLQRAVDYITAVRIVESGARK
ncbi:MAG: hypothetical protein RL088_1783 [Verrucomicrobiota bacterium]|jgi:hypothetical protein